MISMCVVSWIDAPKMIHGCEQKSTDSMETTATNMPGVHGSIDVVRQLVPTSKGFKLLQGAILPARFCRGLPVGFNMVDLEFKV